MQLAQHHTTGNDKSKSGAKTARAARQKGARHKATMRISQSGFFSSLESDSKGWIVAMTVFQGLIFAGVVFGAIYLWKAL